MGYDNRNLRTYQFFFDFGGGADEAISVLLPKGKGATIVDVGVFGVIEVFNGGTLNPALLVGTPSDDDAYMVNWNLGAVADNHGKSLLSTYNRGIPADAAAMDAILVEPDIPATAQEVVLKLMAATGSGLTGQATAFITLRIDD